MVFHNNRNIWYMYWDVTWRRWRQHLDPLCTRGQLKFRNYYIVHAPTMNWDIKCLTPPPKKKTSEIVAIYVFTTFVCRKGDSKPQHFTHRASVLVNEHNMLYFCGGFLVVFIKSTVACFFDNIKLLQFSDVNSTLQVQYSTSQKGFM